MPAQTLPETCHRPGILMIRAGSATYVGPSLDLAAHTTAIHCVVVGIEAPFTVQVGGISVCCRSALIPPRLVHQIVAAPGDRIMFHYEDVTTAAAARLVSAMDVQEGGFAINHAHEQRLIKIGASEAVSDADLADVLGRSTSERPDRRIEDATRRLHEQPGDPAPAGHLANRAGLSTSRFLRLFGEQTGTTFRRYRLWVRMLHAARLIDGGADLTTASADAGFASPSHFSDTFLRMFGLTATAFGATGTILRLEDPPAPKPSSTTPDRR